MAIKTEYFDQLTALSPDHALEDRLTSGEILAGRPEETLHRHDFFEVLYLCRGNCLLMIQGTATTMVPGDICLLGPSAWHRLGKIEEGTMLIQLRMRREFLEQWLDVLPLLMSMAEKKPGTPNLIRGNLEEFADFRQVIKGLTQEIEVGGPAEKEVLSAWINLAMSSLQRCYEQNPQCLQCVYLPTPTNTALRTSEIISYINENYDTVTRKEVAQRFGYDENYMSHLIYNSTGYRFTQLRQLLRLEHARRFIALADYTIEGAAHKVGFKNMSHFYRIFQQTFGCSPADCRSENSAQRIFAEK